MKYEKKVIILLVVPVFPVGICYKLRAETEKCPEHELKKF